MPARKWRNLNLTIKQELQEFGIHWDRMSILRDRGKVEHFLGTRIKDSYSFLLYFCS